MAESKTDYLADGVSVIQTHPSLNAASTNSGPAPADEYSKEEYLCYLGCEIKTPLNAIIGFSQAMKDETTTGATPEEFHRYSQTIFDSSKRLIGMIEDLIEMSGEDAADFDVADHPNRGFHTWVADRRAGETRRRRLQARAQAS